MMLLEGAATSPDEEDNLHRKGDPVQRSVSALNIYAEKQKFPVRDIRNFVF